MKKVIALLVVLMFASSAFAIVGTNTKLLSQADLSPLMTDDNVMIGQYLVNKISNFSNAVVLESDDGGNAFGYMLLKQDFGTIGLSVSPRQGLMSGVSVGNLPGNMLGLQWSNGAVGAGLLVGLDNNGSEVKDPVTTPSNPDKVANSRMFIGLKGGLTIDAGMPLDLGLNVNLASQSDESTDFNNTTAGQKNRIDKISAGEVGANLLARTELAGMLWVLGGTYASGGRDVILQIDGTGNGSFTDVGDTNTLNRYTDTLIQAGLLVGKIIKATETLKVTIATGLGMQMTGSELTMTEDKIANTKNYGPDPVQSSVNAGVPLNVAVEGKLNETWRILGGINTMVCTIASSGYKNRALATDEKPESKDYYTSGSVGVNPDIAGNDFDLGVIGVIGDLQIDLHLDPAILVNGPDFISGSGPGDLAFDVAVAYSWK